MLELDSSCVTWKLSSPTTSWGLISPKFKMCLKEKMHFSICDKLAYFSLRKAGLRSYCSVASTKLKWCEHIGPHCGTRHYKTSVSFMHNTDLRSGGKVPGICTGTGGCWRGWSAGSSGRRSWHPTGTRHPAAWCWELADPRWAPPLHGPSVPWPQLNLLSAGRTDHWQGIFTVVAVPGERENEQKQNGCLVRCREVTK